MGERSRVVTALDLIGLTPLMELTNGRPEVRVGLIDGPLAIDHSDLARESIREIPEGLPGRCARTASAACMHGTFVAGILSAKRGSGAPAICPNCTLLVRAIFAETSTISAQMPGAAPEELASAIVAGVGAGAQVLNLSVGLARISAQGERELQEALDFCARRRVIAVAAAGNQATLGSTPLTRHPWVIPVAACDLRGRPMSESNLGNTVGRRGLMAPGDEIPSVGSTGGRLTFSGTSAAAPFVTGAIALLWSLFPKAPAAQVRSAVTCASESRRKTVVPPLLDAWTAYVTLASAYR